MQIIKVDANGTHTAGPIDLPYSANLDGTHPGNICTPVMVLEYMQGAGWILFEGQPEYNVDTHKLGGYYVEGGVGKRRVDEIPADEQAANLETKQVAAWESIKAERVRRTQTGGYYVPSVGKWFHSDTFSRTQQIGLVMMGANLPAGTQWKTMDGSFVTLTPAMVGAIFQAGAGSDLAVFGAAEAHRAAMLLSSDPATYDFSSGWPLVFETV